MPEPKPKYLPDWRRKRTPWGPVQEAHELAPGIVHIVTAGHGGIKLDRKRNALMPEAARREGGWYEEDVEATMVAMRFPEFFSDKFQRITYDVRDTYPEAYTALTGKSVKVEESRALRNRAFIEANRNNYVVHSALLAEKVLVEEAPLVICWARRESDQHEIRLLVLESLYDRAEFGYVVTELDLKRNERIMREWLERTKAQ